MGSTRNSFLSTYQTKHPAKCLYFDGASGALGKDGTMDTQMLFLYGNTTGPPGKNSSADFLWDDYARGDRLCEWLQSHNVRTGQGIESIIRMTAGFEVIWCNFSSPSLRLVSRFNVSVPLLQYNRTSSFDEGSKQLDIALTVANQDDPIDLPAPDWEIDWEHEPFVASQIWDWFTSASRSYSSEDLASNREPGIRLLDTDLVTLYSVQYQRLTNTLAEHEREQLNLTSDGFWKGASGRQSRQDALKKLMRRRSKHRVGELSLPEIDSFRQSLEHVVSQATGQGSDNSYESYPISWSHVCDMIVNNFANRLMRFQQILQHDHYAKLDSINSMKKRFGLLRERAHALIMPFLEYSVDPPIGVDSPNPSANIDASRERCKAAYLPWSLHGEAPGKGPEAKRHHPVGQAIEEVLNTICSVLIAVGDSIERTWLENFNHDLSEGNNNCRIQPLLEKIHIWQAKLEEVTAWLGWAPHWMGCDRLCRWDVSTPSSDHH